MFRLGKYVILGVIGLTILQFAVSAAHAAITGRPISEENARYYSCSTLRQYWPGGVTANTTDGVGGKGRPHLNLTVYGANYQLDTNHDGRICTNRKAN